MTEQAADGLDAGGVTLQLGQVANAGPAPVAVHDDRHMARQVVRREGVDVGIGAEHEWACHLHSRLVRDRRRVRGAGQRCAGH